MYGARFKLDLWQGKEPWWDEGLRNKVSSDKELMEIGKMMEGD